MQLSRRGLILGCAALTASCAGAARKVTLTPTVAEAVVPPAPEITLAAEPLAPLEPAKPVLDPGKLIRKELLADAMAALERHGDRIPVKDHVFIVDFARHSSKPRLYRLDLETGLVQTYRTAHGRGSDPFHSGFAERFSNVQDSNASSVGAYVTAGQASGAKHGDNVLLDGLDPTNSHARAREIIVHSADYCEPRYLMQHGKLGRSWGCFSVSSADLEVLRPVMDSGRMLFAGT